MDIFWAFFGDVKKTTKCVPTESYNRKALIIIMINTMLKACKPGPWGIRAVLSINNSPGMIGASTLARNFSNSGSDALIEPQIEDKIMEITRNFLADYSYSKPYRLSSKATFSSLGLDSLDAIDLVIEYEERLNIDLTEEDAQNRIKNIKDACIVFSEYARRNAVTSQTTAHSSRLSI